MNLLDKAFTVDTSDFTSDLFERNIRPYDHLKEFDALDVMEAVETIEHFEEVMRLAGLVEDS